MKRNVTTCMRESHILHRHMRFTKSVQHTGSTQIRLQILNVCLRFVEEEMGKESEYYKLLEEFDLKPQVMGGIGNGWVPLVRELLTKLIALGWPKKLGQIKEKFGALRFYADECSDEMFKLISEYEDKSETVCEVCGQPGEIGSWHSSWLRCLCKECRNEGSSIKVG